MPCSGTAVDADPAHLRAGASLPFLFAQLLLNSRNDFTGRHTESLGEAKYCAEGRTLLGALQGGNVASLGPGIKGEPFLRQALAYPKLP